VRKQLVGQHVFIQGLLFSRIPRIIPFDNFLKFNLGFEGGKKRKKKDEIKSVYFYFIINSEISDIILDC
jgi:hypothetical protein